ncbi:restriction endonuclease subunit S [Bacteroides clarus]|uniref:restriction endonuclease subunit S n=1 Tax=Bacteroides clarus TaxID=626929 RepID=UPI0024B09AAB|nr:restriction endonuclease subunit S [Bacteroides clarus]
MNGKQLKNSILQWAIQGKLVPQDPNDEPASVLLERIRAEKAKLVKEKKIKKDKNESIIYRGDDNSYYEKFIATGEVKCIDEEIPFEIPATWEWARFSTIINMSPTVSAEDDVDAAFMPMALINAGYGSGYSYETKKWSLIKTGFTKIAVGDIAYAKITPCFQNRKSFILEDVPGKVAAATTELNVLRLYGQTLYAWYVLYFLKSDYFIKEAKYKGTAGQQRVLSSYVQNKLFPIPPYNEQYRIIGKVQDVFPIVDKYEKSQQGLDKLNALIFDSLKKSILQEAIQGKLVPQIAEEGTAQELLEQIRQEKQKLVKEGKLKKSVLIDSVIYKDDDNKYFEKIGNTEMDITDEIPFEIPDSWSWVRLNDICSYIQRGKSPKYSLIKKYPVVAQKCNQWSGFSIDKAQFIDPDTLSSYGEERILQDGDLMWNSTGLGTLGRMAIYWSSLNPYELAVADSHVTVIRAMKKFVMPQYLYYYFTSNTVQSVIEDKSDGSTKQKELATNTIKTYLVPIPPLMEQSRIISKIEQLASIMRG